MNEFLKLFPVYLHFELKVQQLIRFQNRMRLEVPVHHSVCFE